MMILIIGSWYDVDKCNKCLHGDPDTSVIPWKYPKTFQPCNEWPCVNAFWDGHQTNSFFPNQASGWLIQVFCTYVGYFLLVVGVVQATDMVAKFKRTWRMARGSR